MTERLASEAAGPQGPVEAGPVSWAPEVVADDGGKWAGNQLRFATEAEAKANVANLSWRWTLVGDTRVVASRDPVNVRWDAKLGTVFLDQVRAP